MAGLLTLTPSILPNLGSFGLDSVSLRFTPKHVPNRARRSASLGCCNIFKLSSLPLIYDHNLFGA